MEYSFDTLIIGAGLGGLSAARTLEKYNLSHEGEPVSYAVLEASDTIGGRVQSEKIIGHDGEGLSVNTGAHWFHSDPSPNAPENPLLKHVPSHRLDHDSMPRDFYERGKRANWSSNIHFLNASKKLLEKPREKDTDLFTLFKEHGEVPYILNTTFGEAETGLALNQTSAEDVRHIVPCHMGDFARDGMGAFVKEFAAPVGSHIRLDTPVTKIIRHTDEESQNVDVHTESGDVYHAKRVILTPSVGVLKSGAIEFTPPLPQSHREALDHLQMGQFNKVFLVFDKNYAFGVNHNTHLDVRTKNGEDIFYLARDNGKPVVTAFFGGEHAKRCDHEPKEMVQLAIEGLKEIWGKDVAQHIVDTHVTQWGNNPYVRGGYSRAEVGHFGARKILAKPIDGLIYLAGEAMGAEDLHTGQNWSTHMTGAAISGERAANLVLQSLGLIASKTRAPAPARR